MTVVIILNSLLYNCPVVHSFLSFVFNWLWILSISLQFLFNRWLFLLVAGLKLKNSLTKRQSPPQNSRDKSFFLRKLTTSSASVLNIWSHSFLVCLLIFSSLSLILSCTVLLGSTSTSLEFLHLLSFSTRSVQDTTLEGVLSSCVWSFSRTLTTSIGIWHCAGATKSCLHSPRWSKSSVVIKKVSTQPKFSIWMIRETLRDDNQIRIRGKKLNPDERNGMLWLPVIVSSSNLSLFLAFPLHLNVDSSRCWFVVVQNWRIPPQNGNPLEELSSGTEGSFVPYKMTWFALQWWSSAQALGYFVCSSVHFGLSSTVQDTNPEEALS